MNKAIIDKCQEIISHKNIVLKENKSVYRAINHQEIDVSKYKVDGCVYKTDSDETRCDYLLESGKELYFIELKGSSTKKGLGQVLVSIKSLSRYFDSDFINARIISTRGTRPQRLNTYSEYRDLLRLIGKERVIIQNTPFEENIN